MKIILKFNRPDTNIDEYMDCDEDAIATTDTYKIESEDNMHVNSNIKNPEYIMHRPPFFPQTFSKLKVKMICM